MRSVFKAALLWGAVGLATAAFFFVVSLVTDALAYVELIFWPSSFAFMALDNSTATRLDRVEGTAFLIFTNFALYFVVGLLVTLAWKGLTKLRAHRPTASHLW